MTVDNVGLDTRVKLRDFRSSFYWVTGVVHFAINEWIGDNRRSRFHKTETSYGISPNMWSKLCNGFSCWVKKVLVGRLLVLQIYKPWNSFCLLCICVNCRLVSEERPRKLWKTPWRNGRATEPSWCHHCCASVSHIHGVVPDDKTVLQV